MYSNDTHSPPRARGPHVFGVKNATLYVDVKRFYRAAFLALEPFVHSYGVGKVIDGAPKHLYSKARLAKYRELCAGGQATPRHHAGFHADKFSPKTIEANQARDTRYFASGSDRAVLLYLDMDPPGHEQHRKHGTPYTLEAMADRDATRAWLLGLAGRHLFVSADNRLYLKLVADAEPVERELFKELAAALNAASPHDTDIELKGTYRTPTNYGCLARLPLFRQLDFIHVDQFNAVPPVTASWVRGLVQALEDLAPPQTRRRRMPQSLRPGSTTFAAINLSDTEAADRYWPDCPRKVGELRITQEDHRTLFGILAWCQPNPDGTNPLSRHQALWDALNAEGKTARPFNHRRYKALRDYYDRAGLIDWTDVRYHLSPYGKGEAAKWSFHPERGEERGERRILLKGRFLAPRLVANTEGYQSAHGRSELDSDEGLGEESEASATPTVGA